MINSPVSESEHDKNMNEFIKDIQKLRQQTLEESINAPILDSIEPIIKDVGDIIDTLQIFWSNPIYNIWGILEYKFPMSSFVVLIYLFILPAMVVLSPLFILIQLLEASYKKITYKKQ